MAGNRFGAGLAVAAFIAGASVAGLNSAAVAVADDGVDDSPAIGREARAADPAAVARPSARQAAGRGAASSPRPARSATPQRDAGGDSALPRIAAAAATPVTLRVPTAARSVVALPGPTATVSTAASGPGETTDAAGVIIESTPAPWTPLDTARFSVQRIIDGLGIWLSGLPGGPITDVLSGGLWLVRRSLFPVGADVGTWGVAACVTSGDCTDADLRGADLYGQGLLGVNFAGATLRQADLGATRLTGANLTGAVLAGANLEYASLNGAVAASADLTGAGLAGAHLVNADLAGANLTGAELAGADLTGANLFGATLTGAVFGNTVCPDGSTSSSGCSVLPESANGKPGLIASDRLEVTADTGEFWGRGDEPILYTATLTATLGKDGSAEVFSVTDSPGEITRNLKPGFTTGIPDKYGDNWINYRSGFTPLTADELLKAVKNGQPAAIPIIASVTLALEGDLSPAGLMGGLGTLVTSRLRTIGESVESTPIVVGTGVDQVKVTNGGSGYTSAPTVKFTGGRLEEPLDLGEKATATAIVANGTVTGVKIDSAGSLYNGTPTVTFEGGGGTGATGTAVMKAQGSIQEQALGTLSIALQAAKQNLQLNWLEYAGVGLLQLWNRWLALGDPDDLVGVSATILIPVDSSVVNLFDLAEGKRKLGLDWSYTKLWDFDSGKERQQNFEIRTSLFDTDIQVRMGLLVPASSFTDGEPQSWRTTYSGDFADNDWARWQVDTKGWSEVTWPRPTVVPAQ